MAAVVEVRGLKKSYGPIQAVNGIDLAVEQGEIFGFLGPNGAGKTTTVMLVFGLAMLAIAARAFQQRD